MTTTLVLFAATLPCLYLSYKIVSAFRMRQLLLNTKPRKIGKLQDGFNIIVGVVQAEKTLTSPYRRERCVYYDYLRERHDTYVKQFGSDQFGKGRGEEVTKTQVLKQAKKSVPCVLKDSSGSIDFSFHQAETYIKSEAFRISRAAGGLSHLNTRSEDWHTETIVKPGQKVFIAGEVSVDPYTNDKVIRPGANGIYIISTKGRKIVTAHLLDRVWWNGLLISAICLAAGWFVWTTPQSSEPELPTQPVPMVVSKEL